MPLLPKSLLTSLPLFILLLLMCLPPLVRPAAAQPVVELRSGESAPIELAPQALIHVDPAASPDPQALALSFVSWEVSSRANQWLGANMVRWQSADYDALYRAADTEMDPVRRAALFVRMNELIAEAGYAIPMLARPMLRAMANNLRVPVSPWGSDTAGVGDWFREG